MSSPDAGLCGHSLLEGCSSPLEINRRITQEYIRLASVVQALVDPTFRPGTPSRQWPNWFAIAPHASQEAGKGMGSARIARLIIDLARGKPSPTVGAALDRSGVRGAERRVAEKVGDALSWYGLPTDVSASVGVMMGSANLEALLDPRTLWLTAQRFVRLLHEAPGATLFAKAETVAVTLERLLLGGNMAIFADIATSARAYLEWRGLVCGEVSPEQVVGGFTQPGACAEQARRAWRFGLKHLHDTPRPAYFHQLLPEVSGQSLMVASFALLEEARRAPDVARRNALIALANNYLAFREQHDVVQPTFTPAECPKDEVPRTALVLAMTPLLRLKLGPLAWEFSDYSATQEDRDGSVLTSKPTEYNWALFEDRWPAILHSFEQGYRQPAALWEMPRPLIAEQRHQLAG
jgi:hypothetical protein